MNELVAKKTIQAGVAMAFALLTCQVVTFAQTEEPTYELAFHKYDFPNEPKALSYAKKALRLGDDYYAQELYYHALEEYEKAQKMNAYNGLLNAKLADCHLHTSDYSKASPLIQRAIRLNPDLDGYYYYVKGFLEQYYGNFDMALKSYFNAQDRGSEMIMRFDDLIRLGILQCKEGTRLMNHPLNIRVENMGENINTANNEYIPILTHECDRLMFTTRRKNSVHRDFDESLGDHFEELYYSDYTPEGWTVAKNMDRPINSSNHDATVSVSIDGQNMIVYRDDENGIGNLFIVHKEGEVWGDPIKLPEPINTEHHETAACFDPQMEYLYFVSERPGGFGGKDIYRAAVLLDQAFGEPENLGPNINSAGDDDGIFLFGEDGATMYFSSTGHPGMGGHDIFYSEYKDSAWTMAKNMGYPVNSAADDVCFVRSSDSLYGYMSSSRPDTKGRYDIYQVQFLDLIPTPPPPPMYVDYVGFVLDEENENPLQAVVTAIDVETGETFTLDESDSCDGQYNLKLLIGRSYRVKVDIPGYITKEEIININSADASELAQLSFKLKRLALGTKLVLDNVFYDLNKATLADSSYEALDKIVELLREYPETKVEISAHTDSRGSAEFNKTLSDRRARTCVSYLLSKGIDEKMLVARGYGETQLLITDEQIAQLPEEEREAAHQRNRRTEFKVIE